MANETILVVDADTKSQKVLEVSFKKAGYRVVMTDSIKDAMARIEDEMPELIISDTVLPDGDGLEFCADLQFNPKWKDIPFVFLTEDRSLTQKMRGFELGADDYLTKPAYIKEVTTRVELLLQKRAKELLAESDVEEFEGDLSEITMIDLLQTIENELRSGSIVLTRNRRQAALYFREGNILDAICGKLQGEQAIYRMMRWPAGHFAVSYHDNVRRADHIEKNPGELLLEGIRRLDIWNDAVAKLPNLDRVYEVDYQRLPSMIDELPVEVERMVRLFDGLRSLRDVLDDSPTDDVKSLQIVHKLLDDDLLLDVSPAQHPGHSGSAQKDNLDEWLSGDPHKTAPGLPAASSDASGEPDEVTTLDLIRDTRAPDDDVYTTQQMGHSDVKSTQVGHSGGEEGEVGGGHWKFHWSEGEGEDGPPTGRIKSLPAREDEPEATSDAINDLEEREARRREVEAEHLARQARQTQENAPQANLQQLPVSIDDDQPSDEEPVEEPPKSAGSTQEFFIQTREREPTPRSMTALSRSDEDEAQDEEPGDVQDPQSQAAAGEEAREGTTSSERRAISVDESESVKREAAASMRQQAGRERMVTMPLGSTEAAIVHPKRTRRVTQRIEVPEDELPREVHHTEPIPRVTDEQEEPPSSERVTTQVTVPDEIKQAQAAAKAEAEAAEALAAQEAEAAALAAQEAEAAALAAQEAEAAALAAQEAEAEAAAALAAEEAEFAAALAAEEAEAEAAAALAAEEAEFAAALAAEEAEAEAEAAATLEAEAKETEQSAESSADFPVVEMTALPTIERYAQDREIVEAEYDLSKTVSRRPASPARSLPAAEFDTPVPDSSDDADEPARPERIDTLDPVEGPEEAGEDKAEEAGEDKAEEAGEDKAEEAGEDKAEEAGEDKAEEAGEDKAGEDKAGEDKAEEGKAEEAGEDKAGEDTAGEDKAEEPSIGKGSSEVRFFAQEREHDSFDENFEESLRVGSKGWQIPVVGAAVLALIAIVFVFFNSPSNGPADDPGTGVALTSDSTDPVEKPVVEEVAPPTGISHEEAGMDATAKSGSVEGSARHMAMLLAGEDPNVDPEVTEPVVDEPVVEEPVVEEPVVEEPVVEEPVVEKPVVAKPVVEKPVVEKPVVAKPQPSHAEQVTNLRTLIRRERINEALVLARELSKSAPKDRTVAFLHGQAALYANNKTEAIEHLSRAERLGMKTPELYLELAPAYQSAGQMAKAKQAYEKFLELQPNGRAADQVRTVLQNQF